MSKDAESNQVPEEESPAIDPWLSEKLDSIFERLEAHKRLFDEELLRLIGLMSVRFNLLEMHLKISLSILQRDEMPLRKAYHEALRIQNSRALFQKVKEVFQVKISTPAAQHVFEEILDEADALRKERNLFLHSVWRPTSDPEKPFVREKHDEDETEIDFDIPTVQRLVDRLEECSYSNVEVLQ